MRAVKGRDTSPELIVRKWLWAHGYRFRCQYRRAPGRPDVAIPKLRTLIEVRGCFWHRHENCELASTPKSNSAFWRRKFAANVARDARHEREWHELGWNVIIIWECGLRTESSRSRTFAQVEKWLGEFRRQYSL